MKKICKGLMAVTAAIFFLGCAAGPACYTVKRPNGQSVCLQSCVPIVKYQENVFGIKGINIPIPVAGTTNIGEVTWDTKILQTAASTSQVLDIQRVSRCQRMSVIATSITDDREYDSLLRKTYEDEEKINQLALLITLNNPAAVVNWIDAYSKEVAPGDVDKSLSDPHLKNAVPVVRGFGHAISIPKEAKARSLDSFF